MKKIIVKLYRRWCANFNKIHLVDKCLILLMIILLLQSGHNLFANTHMTNESNNIDVIVRTAAASIFGYFLSANFIKRRPSASDPETTDGTREANFVESKPSKEDIKNQIGFGGSVESPKSDAKNAKATLFPKREEVSESRIQVIIATGIGIFSLSILLLVRNGIAPNVEITTPSALSTISQLRDFISSCVGFLIGSAKNDSN